MNRTTQPLLSLIAICAVLLCGCREERPLGFHVATFSHDNVTTVALNAALVFNFSHEVNPHSINSDTIQIFTHVDGRRIDAGGTFEVAGRTVTWFPQPTNKPYPVTMDQADGPPSTGGAVDPSRGDSEAAAKWIMASDAGLNTSETGVEYEVVVPSLPSPNTVRTQSGRAIRTPFNSSFRTLPSGPRMFTRDAPYYRNSLRIADVLAYDGATFNRGSAPGFKDWILHPESTRGENPLYLSPAHALQARLAWQDRDNTGEWVDEMFGVQLLPRLTHAEMGDNVFPAGVPVRDERLISNVNGVQTGRGKAVTGVRLFFTQPLPPQIFHGLPWERTGVVIERLDDPSAAQGEPVGFVTALDNVPDLHVAQLTIQLDRPIHQGWLRITVDPASINGLTGTRLEGNAGDRFVHVWPVRINAKP